MAPTPAPATAAPVALKASTDVRSRPAALADLLVNLQTASENTASYDCGDYEHDRRDLRDTSGINPHTRLTFNASTYDVDHIVAAKEAHESGVFAWSVSTRRQFGNEPSNLLASRDCVNRSKGSSAMAKWSSARSGACAEARPTAEGACFSTARTIAVKHRWDLAVDTGERSALHDALQRCREDRDVATPSRGSVVASPTTAAAPTTTTPPRRSQAIVIAPSRAYRTCPAMR